MVLTYHSTWRNIRQSGVFKTSLFLFERVSECRRMEYKGGTEVIRLAVWARVLVFIHNLLVLMRRIVCMFVAAWRKCYCLKQLQTTAFYQGNTQQRQPWFDNVETFHPAANILHSIPSWCVSSFVPKTERFLQNLLNETHNTSSQSKVNAHYACLWNALWILNGNLWQVPFPETSS